MEEANRLTGRAARAVEVGPAPLGQGFRGQPAVLVADDVLGEEGEIGETGQVDGAVFPDHAGLGEHLPVVVGRLPSVAQERSQSLLVQASHRLGAGELELPQYGEFAEGGWVDQSQPRHKQGTSPIGQRRHLLSGTRMPCERSPRKLRTLR